MRKRGKLKTLANITLTFPTSSRRFKCHYSKEWKDKEMLTEREDIRVKKDERSMWVWGFFHSLKDGDTLILCDELGCNDIVCQRHYPDHQEWHLLTKLGK